ncbi:TD and POZ domain-containing protein 4 [Trichonephila clavata]|uniref:TD and POZ domain-containing protein 4 n=1 Tax=Trichonephila clavata TaxID=2740835 RepID=A0A8X6IP69_TRICU|nr:TD and POZ domain-containing protein 4 [Trichonephila clavata]
MINCGKGVILAEKSEKSVLFTLPFTKRYLIEHSDLYLKNDVLSLVFEYSWCDGYFSIEGENAYFEIYQNGNRSIGSNYDIEHCVKEDDLKKDLELLYNEGTLSDVKLCTSNQTFHAHKAILSARSPVFRAMFTTDMQEKIQECVNVPDVEDDTVRRMLRYMYSNTLEGFQWESAWKLYSAADKYEILTLKRNCSSFFKRNLSPSKVCDVLVLADMHLDGDLKKAAEDYVFENEMNVFNSEEWTDFTKNNVTLAAETMLLKWKRKPE